jgi:hypothetical protein
VSYLLYSVPAFDSFKRDLRDAICEQPLIQVTYPTYPQPRLKNKHMVYKTGTSHLEMDRNLLLPAF